MGLEALGWVASLCLNISQASGLLPRISGVKFYLSDRLHTAVAGYGALGTTQGPNRYDNLDSYNIYIANQHMNTFHVYV